MKRTEITIEAKYGSDFQEKFAGDTLLSMLTSWSQHLKEKHKKNSIKVYFNGYSIDDSEEYKREETRPIETAFMDLMESQGVRFVEMEGRAYDELLCEYCEEPIDQDMAAEGHGCAEGKRANG